MLFTLWLCIPVLFAAAWLRLSGGRVLRHVATLHFLVYFIAIYAGSYSLFVTGGEKNETFIWSVMAYPVLALLGAGVARLVLPVAPFRAAVVDLRSSPPERQIVYALLIGFAILLGIYLAILGRNVPLYVLLTQDPEAAQLARFFATKGYKTAFGDIGLIVNFSRIFTDYFALFLLIFEYCRVRAEHVRYRRIVTMAVFLVLATTLFGERYPLLKLVTYFAFALVALRYRILSARVGLVLVLVSLLLIPLTGLLHGATHFHFEYLASLSTLQFLEWSWDVVAGRVLFSGQVLPLYHIFDLIPGTYDFFAGRTLDNPRGILPYEQVILPFLIFDSYGPALTEIQGSDPTVFFGELYANFGLVGCFAGMLVAGFTMQLVDSVLSQKIDHERSIYFVALHFMVMVYIADYAIGFTTIYFDYRTYFLVLLFTLPSIASLLTYRNQREVA